jgi:subtilase family serine protease
VETDTAQIGIPKEVIMKYKLKGLVVAMAVIFVFLAAQMQTQGTEAQIQKPQPPPQSKPDYVPVIEVSQGQDGSSPVANGGYYTNGPAFLRLKVKNDGTADTTAASKVNYAIYLDNKQIKNVSNQNLTGGIKKGQSQTVLDNFRMGPNLFGKWKIAFSVDVANQIGESNEKNNGAFFTCTCQKLF